MGWPLEAPVCTLSLTSPGRCSGMCWLLAHTQLVCITASDAKLQLPCYVSQLLSTTYCLTSLVICSASAASPIMLCSSGCTVLSGRSGPAVDHIADFDMHTSIASSCNLSSWYLMKRLPLVSNVSCPLAPVLSCSSFGIVSSGLN